MPFVVISPPPVLQFVDQNGKPLSGGLLFTYAGGTTTKTPTFTDSTGAVANTNPIVLNLFGEPPQGVWIPPATNIKFVLSPPGDSDPPTAPIWTQDNVAAPTTQFGTLVSQNANNVNISGGTIIVGTLQCTGATTLSTLTVTGLADLDGNLNVHGTSAVLGNATFSSPVIINATVDINASRLSLGSTAGVASVEIQSLSSGFNANVLLQTGASSRWGLYKDNTAESGGNTGSNFKLDAYADSGNVNFTAMAINRSTGLVTIGSMLINTSGGLTFSNQTSGAAASTATLTNAPVAGNPSVWVPVTVNGVAGWIPFWHP